jgi:outer membrane protein assembly factor BamB
MPDDPAPPPQKPVPASSPERLFPGWVVRGILIFLLVAVLLLRIFQDQVAAWGLGEGEVNIAMYVAVAISVIALWLWFSFRSTYSVPARLTVFFVGLLCALFLVATVRPVGITGNWIPTGWRFVWQQPRDYFRLRPVAPVHRPGGEGDPAAAPQIIESTPHDFPQFLGPNRDGYLPDAQLAHDWQANPPKLLWRREVGAGWSGFAVVADRAVTLEQYGAEEWITCRNLETGELLWSHVSPARHEEFMGGIGPRSTPTIHESKVYTVGGTGIVTCLHLDNGQVVWQDNLRQRYSLKDEDDLAAVMWGRSNSPLVHGSLCIVPAGGKSPVSLLAYDKLTGKKRWEGGNTQISYASPTVMELSGKEQIVSVNESNVTGHDPETGEELWSYKWPGSSRMDASASQPHALGENRVFVSKGYGQGSALFQVAELGGEYRSETIWHDRRLMQTKFTNAVIVDGHAYGLNDGIFQCIDAVAGKKKWTAGRYGHGQILAAGDVILVQTEKTGELVMLAIDPEKHRELGRIASLNTQSQAWNNLCLVGNKLLLRNADEAICLELP